MNYICEECGYISEEAGLCPTCHVYLKEVDEDIEGFDIEEKEDFGTVSDIDFLGEGEEKDAIPFEEELDTDFFDEEDEQI
jgi:predicted ATP-dependent serine protease